MDKRVFDDAIGEVPPSTVDVDAVIAGGRRAARVRRLANPAVAAGVAVVALTGVVAYTMTGDEGGGVPVGSPNVASSETTAPPAPSTTGGPSSEPGPPPTSGINIADGAVPPSQCDTDDLESPGEVKGRLTAAATAAVGEQRPDAQLTANAEGQYPQGTPHGPLEFYQVNNQQAGEPLPVCDANGYFMAVATTQTPEGGGNLLFTVSPAYVIEGKSMNCDISMTEVVYCDLGTGPGGETILKTIFRFPSGTTMNRVEIVRPDGVELMLQAENTGTSSKSEGAPASAAPPLTHDQLVAIGIDPALTVFPK